MMDGTLGCEPTKVAIDTLHGPVSGSVGRGTEANIVRPTGTALRTPSRTRERMPANAYPRLDLEVGVTTRTSCESSPEEPHNTGGCNG